MKHKTKIAGIALLCLALGSQALTLGRIRGAVLVGRSLDVAVQVQLDASESAASLCFDADVFHGDTRQEASRVRVRVEPTAQAQSVQVRILSSAIIDEPVVTVYLRSGCQQKITRTYVLLAELTSELAPPLPALLGAPSATARPPASAPPPWAQPMATAEAAKPALRAQRPAPRRAENAAQPKPRSVMSGATRKVAPAAGQARLTLDLLELMEDREPTLNFSTEMLSQPSADPQRRSEAAALWRALNASPEEILRQSAQALALQADVSSLKTLTVKNQAGLSDLTTRLHRAESERFSAWVVYALLAALLACLAALALVWRRQRSSVNHDQDWWDRVNTGQPGSVDMTEAKVRPEPKPEPGAPARGVTPTAKVSATAATPPSSGHAGVWKDSSPASNMDVSMVEVSHSIFDELMQADADRLVAPEITATNSSAAPTRSLNALTIISQQQVNLLVAQGRPEEAIGLLKQHLHDGGSPNPVLYLELLSLLHTLGLKADFSHYREEFGRFFTGRIPEFSIFKNEGRRLDANPQLLSRITELWPSPQVVEVLQACIFQDHYEARHQPFDLAAFRELLLLYAVAQRLALMPPALKSQAAPASQAQPESPDLLDLDLSEPQQAPAGFGPKADLDVDIALPISDESNSGAPSAHLLPASQHGNLIDFDPPEQRKHAPPRRT